MGWKKIGRLHNYKLLLVDLQIIGCLDLFFSWAEMFSRRHVNNRVKLLFLASLVYAFLLTLLEEAWEGCVAGSYLIRY